MTKIQAAATSVATGSVPVDIYARDSTFNQVAKVLHPARCRLRARDKNFHVLKGIALCGCGGRAMIPNASGKRNAAGQLYRFYTCGLSHKERADARCAVKHVSASALETAVLGQRQ